MKRIRLASVFFVALACVAVIPIQQANALSGSEFRAGRIIDDAIFTNKNAMSVEQVQQFLNAKVPACDNWGTQPYAGTTRRAYSEARGITFPLTCVRDYYENPTTKQNNLEGRPIPSGAWSAAQIIHDAGQRYNINPQVLIVLLQKEQGLTTDDWPWPIQFRSATGYGCPDTAACDSQYYGFYNQVSRAAYQFRRYADFPTSYNHIAGQHNNVRISPNAACGSTSVYIHNQSTASLYNYTPYQPNQAALNNLYGTGDGCSAYGNRNFWRYFNDWFGSTLAAEYSWENFSNYQYAYTDSSKTTPVDLRKLRPGQRVFIGFYVRNSGTVTWSNNGSNPTRVGTTRPQGRMSPFCDPSWINCQRPSNIREGTVAPGQVGSFEFWYQAPTTPGTYLEYFKPVIEGVAWMNETGMHFYTEVKEIYNWHVADQYAYTNNSKTTPVSLNDVQPGQRVYVGFKALNTGNMTWINSGANALRAGASTPQDRISQFCDSTWISCSRAATMQEASVAPGQVGTFEFWYKAPYQGGTFVEHFKPVIEGKAWTNDTGMNFYTKVQNPVFSWVNEGGIQYSYTDPSKTTPVSHNSLQPGQRIVIGFKARNTGNTVWRNTGPHPARVGASQPTDRLSGFCDATWVACSRPGNLLESEVAPGQVGTFEFWYKAPTTPGTYLEYFKPVVENTAWLNNTGMYFHTVVD